MWFYTGTTDLIATNVTQILMSPGFPFGYANNQVVRWLITAPIGSRVWFNVTNIDVEPQLVCVYDYVAVYDGKSSFFMTGYDCKS